LTTAVVSTMDSSSSLPSSLVIPTRALASTSLLVINALRSRPDARLMTSFGLPPSALAGLWPFPEPSKRRSVASFSSSDTSSSSWTRMYSSKQGNLPYVFGGGIRIVFSAEAELGAEDEEAETGEGGVVEAEEDFGLGETLRLLKRSRFCASWLALDLRLLP